jgi:hypothetical protein
MATNNSKLYLIYNADGSIVGKIGYGYRKITQAKGHEPICAACDITHGGLSLNETPAWSAAKKEIESLSNLKVVQLHKDELSLEVSPGVLGTLAAGPGLTIAYSSEITYKQTLYLHQSLFSESLRVSSALLWTELFLPSAMEMQRPLFRSFRRKGC